MPPRTLRPLGPADLPSLRLLAAREDTARSIGASAFDPPTRWESMLRACVEEKAHGYGLVDGLTLRAAAFVQTGRFRRSHSGRVTLLLRRGKAAKEDGVELLAALTDISRRWLALSRLELEGRADDELLGEVAGECAWAPEVRRRGAWRTDGPTDTVEYAWIRSDLVSGIGGAPVALPARGVRVAPEDVAFRGVQPEDAPFYVTMQQQESVLRGTLQVPTTPPEGWARRLRRGQEAGTVSLLATVKGRPAGLISLHRFPRPAAHATGLGMFVHGDFQGRGLGRLLVERVLRAADGELGVDRVELEVYPENIRGLRLYEGTGFVREGVRRCMAWRDGAYADGIVMARSRPVGGP